MVSIGGKPPARDGLGEAGGVAVEPLIGGFRPVVVKPLCCIASLLCRALSVQATSEKLIRLCNRAWAQKPRGGPRTPGTAELGNPLEELATAGPTPTTPTDPATEITSAGPPVASNEMERLCEDAAAAITGLRSRARVEKGILAAQLVAARSAEATAVAAAAAAARLEAAASVREGEARAREGEAREWRKRDAEMWERREEGWDAERARLLQRIRDLERGPRDD
ncbi:MAG: hypothetical protein M1840_001267 [Geoglossum simile]|nr:MAG: hypothetical protein M1840_001267 [Geoglossum simile]